MAGRTGREEKSNSSPPHLISLFSQQGQELRKPPSKGLHTGSAQKPKDLASSKPPRMCCEEQMGSPEEEEEEEEEEESAETALPCTAPARTCWSWENKPELLRTAAWLPAPGPERSPASRLGAGARRCCEPGDGRDRHSASGQTHPDPRSGAPGIPGIHGSSPARSCSARRPPAEPPALSWGVPGETHPVCRAPPPRGSCCAGSA